MFRLQSGVPELNVAVIPRATDLILDWAISLGVCVGISGGAESEGLYTRRKHLHAESTSCRMPVVLLQSQLIYSGEARFSWAMVRNNAPFRVLPAGPSARSPLFPPSRPLPMDSLSFCVSPFSKSLHCDSVLRAGERRGGADRLGSRAAARPARRELRASCPNCFDANRD